MKEIKGKYPEKVRQLIELLLSAGFKEDESSRISKDKRVFKKDFPVQAPPGSSQKKTYRYEITSIRIKKSVTYGSGWLPLRGGYLKNIEVTREGKISGMKKGG